MKKFSLRINLSAQKKKILIKHIKVKWFSLYYAIDRIKEMWGSIIARILKLSPENQTLESLLFEETNSNLKFPRYNYLYKGAFKIKN